MNIDVLFLIEHPARELDIACVLSLLLESKFGLKSHIASLSFDLWKTIQNYKPRLIVTPFVYSKKDYVVFDLNYHYSGIPILAMNFEQALAGTDVDYFLPKDDFSKRSVWHLAWAHQYEKMLIDRGVDPNHILLSGHPQLGLMLSPYLGTIPTREYLANKYGLDASKKWLFFPLNYSWAFLSQTQLQGRIARGYNPENAKIYQDFLKESISVAADWWWEAAHQENVELIIRPKPNAPKEVFVKHLLGLWEGRGRTAIPKSIHFIQELRVADWSLAVDQAYTSFSTSIYQTLLTDKPGWVMETMPFPEFLRTDVNDLVPALKTKEAFLCSVTSAAHWATEMAVARKNIRKRWLPEGDPLNAIVHHISRLLALPFKPISLPQRLVDIIEYKALRIKNKVSPPQFVNAYDKEYMANHYFTNEQRNEVLNKWRHTLSTLT